MDYEKSTGLIVGFFVALMFLDFDTLDKQILIYNGTQLLFDYKHMKELPSRIISIHSGVTNICRLAPNDCQQDIEKFQRVNNLARLWLRQNTWYNPKVVKEEHDNNLQGISKPFPRGQYWAPVKEQAAKFCPVEHVDF